MHATSVAIDSRKAELYGIWRLLLQQSQSTIERVRDVSMQPRSASHFSGPLYTLDLTLANATSGTLSVAGQVTGCGRIPAWLHVDKASKTVYCFDESWFGSGVLAQFSASEDASLTLAASAPRCASS